MSGTVFAAAIIAILAIASWVAEARRRRLFNARMFALDLATRGDPDAKSAIADAEAFHAFLTK